MGVKKRINTWIKKMGPKPNGPNILITGVPRSGTTLTCYLLHQLPNVIALNEAIRVGQLRTIPKAYQGIQQFLSNSRDSLYYDGIGRIKSN